VETDHAFDVCPTSREFDHGGTTEAVADGGKFGGICAWILAKRLECIVHARAEERSVALILASYFAGVRWLRADAFSVNICDEHVVPESGKFTGSFLFVVADTCPLVHNENARAFVYIEGIVVTLPAFADDTPGGIFISFLDDRRGERTVRSDESEKRGEEGFHVRQLN